LLSHKAVLDLSGAEGMRLFRVADLHVAELLEPSNGGRDDPGGCAIRAR
jgi:hypothetical protein